MFIGLENIQHGTIKLKKYKYVFSGFTIVFIATFYDRYMIHLQAVLPRLQSISAKYSALTSPGYS